MTHKPEHRPFSLQDAMILVAALAGGIALSRFELRALMPDAAGQTWQMLVNLSLQPLPFIVALLSPTAWTLSLALILIRLLPPRPRRLRLARQPGFVACAAVVVSVLLPVVMAFLLAIAARFPFLGVRPGSTLASRSPWPNLLLGVSFQAGGLVAAAWGTLAFAGRFRPEASWIDRSGRVLGVFCIVLFLAGWLHILL